MLAISIPINSNIVKLLNSLFIKFSRECHKWKTSHIKFTMKIYVVFTVFTFISNLFNLKTKSNILLCILYIMYLT